MLGSAVATGRIALRRPTRSRMLGLTLHGELEKIGFSARGVGQLLPHAYLECHIEQGPLLRSYGADIGVVSGVQAISWQELTITGKSAHAGTTPMSFRRDAGLAAAKVSLALREMTLSGRYGADMRAAMGMARLSPGMVNVVAGRAVCSVDLRNPSDALMRQAEEDFAARCEAIAKEEGVTLSRRQTAKTPSVPFDASVQALIAGTAEAFAAQADLSGAGHDAQEWVAVQDRDDLRAGDMMVSVITRGSTRREAV